jgi:hypothetical protein
LRWISYRTRAFSIAKYRLDRIGPMTADFFDPNSVDTYQKRISVMTEALDDAIRYLDRGIYIPYKYLFITYATQAGFVCFT